MLKSSFCDYSDVYIFASRIITVAPQAWDNQNNSKKSII